LIGNILWIVIPCLLTKYYWKENLSNLGLGLPPEGLGKTSIVINAIVFAAILPFFLIGDFSSEMRTEYPLYRGKFENFGQYIVYELGYFWFFLSVEFFWRGFLVNGIFYSDSNTPESDALIKDNESGIDIVKEPNVLSKNILIVLISMLSYCTWHIGKPKVEYWTTPFWGILHAFIVLQTKCLWPGTIGHWLWNAISDFILWQTSQ